MAEDGESFSVTLSDDDDDATSLSSIEPPTHKQYGTFEDGADDDDEQWNYALEVDAAAPPSTDAAGATSEPAACAEPTACAEPRVDAEPRIDAEAGPSPAAAVGARPSDCEGMLAALARAPFECTEGVLPGFIARAPPPPRARPPPKPVPSLAQLSLRTCCSMLALWSEFDAGDGDDPFGLGAIGAALPLLPPEQFKTALRLVVTSGRLGERVLAAALHEEATDLELSGAPLGDELGDALGAWAARCPRLRRLALADCAATRATLARAAAGHACLEDLDLSGTLADDSLIACVLRGVHGTAADDDELVRRALRPPAYDPGDAAVIATSLPPPPPSSLTALSLNDCSSITDATLRALAAAAPGLRALALARNSALSGRGVRALAGLRALERLSLKGCARVDGVPAAHDADGLDAQQPVWPRLETLDVKGLSLVEPNAWASLLRPYLAPAAPLAPRGLRVLKMGECALGDAALAACFAGLPTGGAAARAPPPPCALHTLDLSWCDGLPVDALVRLTERAGNSLCTLKLRCAALRGADGDEASDVERVARACPELKKLNLARVGAGIDDAGACALARGGARASLTDLDLSWTEVGDDGCHALFRSCSALKLLAVQGCKALTPRCVRGLFEEADEREVAAPALQWIDFSWVNTMSVTLAEAVLRARPELAIVDYYGDLLKGSQCDLEFKRSPT